jgi:hypothetical protein
MLGLASLSLVERIGAVDALPAKRLADHLFLLEMAPAGKAFVQAIGRAEAARGASRCLVALRRRELAGPTGPADLEAAVKEAGMVRVPADPFRLDGGPLRMVVVEGKPVVYSVGLDSVDDGGILDAKLGNEPRGDFLYRLKPEGPSRD